ncbi:MAG: diaminopimelate epimerase [Vicinamibacterales bacterium]
MSHTDPLPLVKAHALGNDFLLTPALAGAMGGHADLARHVCDRHRGLGADGLMFLHETEAGADTRLFNADGGEAEVSGNGVRCAAAWLAHTRALAAGDSLTIGTVAGPKRLELLGADAARYTFRAEMGPPTDLRVESLDVSGHAIEAVVLRVGNPQCVVLGAVNEERLHTLASVLSVHPFFPDGTNVELATVEAPDLVRILIWERGVGPTEASGTGACAAAVAAAFKGGASRAVSVVSPGGTQSVEWTSDTIWLTGWAEIVGVAEWWGAF